MAPLLGTQFVTRLTRFPRCRSPMGRKFRSQNEVRRYLEQIDSELSPELFCFNPYAQAGTPGRRRANPSSAAKSGKKLTSKAVKAARAKSLGGAGDASSSSTKIKVQLRLVQACGSAGVCGGSQGGRRGSQAGRGS